MKLDFIIIGGQKCGSTYLQSIISQHPSVNMPNGESPHFESPDYENNGMKRLKFVLDDLAQIIHEGIKK